MLNYGVFVGHEPARDIVLDSLTAEDTFDSTNVLLMRGKAAADGRNQWATDVPTPEQHEKILTIIENGLREGAIGVASMVGYTGYGTPTYEMYDLQKNGKEIWPYVCDTSTFRAYRVIANRLFIGLS